jgi:signal transduction histidine kinase
MGLILGRMMVGNWPEFLASYFGYGALALGLAFLYSNLGPWSVLLFLAPLLVARQALIREQNLHKLTERLRQRERMLKRAFDRIADERKDERTRIAYDLHGDVLQSLVRISQLGGFIRGEIKAPSVSADLKELTHLSTETADKVRRVVGNLQSSAIGSCGLLSSLSSLVRDLELSWRGKIKFDALLDGEELPAVVELTTYQVVKEALENAVRYSEASEIRVLVTRRDRYLRVSISDDGVGFDPAAVDRRSHFGLGLLEARVHLSGGTLEVRSSPKGTDVSAELPVEKAEPEEPILDSSGLDC